MPHQDGCISFTKPTSGMTFWYTLEDATVENGCLLVAPGSHLTEPLSQRLTKGKGRRRRHWAAKFRGLERAAFGQKKAVGIKPKEVKSGSGSGSGLWSMSMSISR